MTSYPPASLRAALATGPLPPTETVEIAVQLCDVLIPAHARGAAAHDIAPEAILLVARTARLAALPAGADRDPYLAPERRRGWSTGDARSDVYSIGVVLYEMLVGRPPVGQFPWPGQVNGAARWLDPVVLRCLSDDPARRYASAAELRADLVGTQSATAPIHVRQRGWRGTAAVVVGALVLALILAVLLLRLAAQPTAQQVSAVTTPTPTLPATPSPMAAPPSAADLSRELAQQQAELAEKLRQMQMRRVPTYPQAVQSPTPAGEDTPLAGGVSVFGGGPFHKATGNGLPVRGIRYALGKWGQNNCLRQVDPIYDTTDDGSDPQVLMARPGYAVGGLQVDVDDTNAVAMAVVFMAYRNGHLVPNDRYVSDWVGFPENRQASRTLGGDGRTVIGLCGRQGMNLNAVGLVMVPN